MFPHGSTRLLLLDTASKQLYCFYITQHIDRVRGFVSRMKLNYVEAYVVNGIVMDLTNAFRSYSGVLLFRRLLHVINLANELYFVRFASRKCSSSSEIFMKSHCMQCIAMWLKRTARFLHKHVSERQRIGGKEKLAICIPDFYFSTKDGAACPEAQCHHALLWLPMLCYASVPESLSSYGTSLWLMATRVHIFPWQKKSFPLTSLTISWLFYTTPHKRELRRFFNIHQFQ